LQNLKIGAIQSRIIEFLIIIHRVDKINLITVYNILIRKYMQ